MFAIYIGKRVLNKTTQSSYRIYCVIYWNYDGSEHNIVL